MLIALFGCVNVFATDGEDAGPEFVVNDNTYRIISEKSGTVAFVSSKDEESVSVPASLISEKRKLTITRIEADAFRGENIRTVTICGGVEYIDKNAFRESGAVRLVIKTKNLTEESLEGVLADSSIDNVYIRTRGDLFERYRSYFAEENTGKKVTVRFSPDMALPLPEESFTITSEVGLRESPGGIGSTDHKGLDLAAPMGTPIYASLGGKVIFAGEYYGYGNCVVIKTGDIVIWYGHMSNIYCQKGDVVSKSQQIGEVGSSGVSTGSHLHFEMHQCGMIIDPQPLLGLR
jgi:murein DD-endopeptidase MepM/ murein hydrolase activator NlpD